MSYGTRDVKLNLNEINCKKLSKTNVNVLFNYIKRQYSKFEQTREP